MDVDKNDNVRASIGSSTSSGTVSENVVRCKQVKASAMDIVQALTSFIRIEKGDKAGGTKEFVVVKCPNGKYCKNPNGEIRYQNKTGFKNPCSHLRSCLARVRGI